MVLAAAIRSFAWLALAAAALSIAPAAIATLPLITDETDTQGPGGNQVEAQLSVSATSHPVRSIEPQVTLTRGITETVDLFVVPDWVSYEIPGGARSSGWANTAIGAKWRVVGNADEGASFALKSQVFLPLSEQAELRVLGTARTSWSLVGIASHALDWGAVHVNVEWLRSNYANSALRTAIRQNQFRVSAAPVWEVDDAWRLAVDAGLSSRALRDASGVGAYAQLAAIYEMSKDVELALGVERDFRVGDASATTVNLGYTVRFR